jgi:hypothetical protein
MGKGRRPYLPARKKSRAGRRGRRSEQGAGDGPEWGRVSIGVAATSPPWAPRGPGGPGMPSPGGPMPFPGRMGVSLREGREAGHALATEASRPPARLGQNPGFLPGCLDRPRPGPPHLRDGLRRRQPPGQQQCRGQGAGTAPAAPAVDRHPVPGIEPFQGPVRQRPPGRARSGDAVVRDGKADPSDMRVGEPRLQRRRVGELARLAKAEQLVRPPAPQGGQIGGEIAVAARAMRDGQRARRRPGQGRQLRGRCGEGKGTGLDGGASPAAIRGRAGPGRAGAGPGPPAGPARR